MSEIIAFEEAGESPFDAIRRTHDDGTEYWSARDLMPLLGYRKWERFADTIDRAKVSATNQGLDVASEFVQVSEYADAGNLGTKERRDFALSRMACYLVAMNGDPRKEEVSAAQGYFALRTREAETSDDNEMSLIRMAQRVIESETRRIEARRALTVLLPKAEKFDQWQDSGDTLYVEEWGKALGMTRPESFNHLRALGVLSKRRRTDGVEGHVNVPNARYQTLFEMKQEFVPDIGIWTLVPRMTPRGAVLLAEMLVRSGRIPAERIGYTPAPALPGEIDGGDR